MLRCIVVLLNMLMSTVLPDCPALRATAIPTNMQVVYSTQQANYRLYSFVQYCCPTLTCTVGYNVQYSAVQYSTQQSDEGYLTAR